jgi:hypothetical protein
MTETTFDPSHNAIPNWFSTGFPTGFWFFQLFFPTGFANCTGLPMALPATGFANWWVCQLSLPTGFA